MLLEAERRRREEPAQQAGQEHCLLLVLAPAVSGQRRLQRCQATAWGLGLRRLCVHSL